VARRAGNLEHRTDLTRSVEAAQPFIFQLNAGAAGEGETLSIGEASPGGERDGVGMPGPGGLRVPAGASRTQVPLAVSNALSTELEIWLPVLRALNVTDDQMRRVIGRADTNATSIEAELLVSGLCDERSFFEAVARVLDVEYAPHIDPETLVMRDRDGPVLLRSGGNIRIGRVLSENGRSMIAVAPDADGFRRLKSRLDASRELAPRLRIVAPSQLRKAVKQRCLYLVERKATGALFDALPYCSSRVVLTGAQGFVGATLIALAIAALIIAPLSATIGLHVFFTLFFFGCVALRLAAISRANAHGPPELLAPDPAVMPRYSVLVALYQEVDMVPELLQALGKLVWPRSKLEIKLVCEADDRDTIAALEAHELRPWIEIIKVPRGAPRTKPKALAHALQLCSGDYVALYDAEDKPHPWQLVEAWQRFAATDQALACLQAPLAISNGHRGILSRMFAFEYAGLFRGILPFLSANMLILPLGGTSNHFRRSALVKMGGWDPYNVTEDADLGLRMRRFGYRTETISYPTYEIAPENWIDWRNQRTRWFKGWIQTWLVHMRDPRRLAVELGFRSFWVSQILFAGMVVSALVHPILFLTILWLLAALATGSAISPYQPVLIGLDLANIALGYTAFYLLGRSTTPRGQRGQLWKIALFTPIYWFMQSIAAWRAVIQLWRDPHLCGLMYQRHQISELS
jgi:cellulose synthase/poly-beta-1,6-N-acetylglucosamine synthase-like glycosyltransferase